MVTSEQSASYMAVSKPYVKSEPEEDLYDLALAVSQCPFCHTLFIKASPGWGWRGGEHSRDFTSWWWNGKVREEHLWDGKYWARRFWKLCSITVGDWGWVRHVSVHGRCSLQALGGGDLTPETLFFHLGIKHS